MSAFSAGLLDKLFYNSGTYGSPTLTLVDNIEDLNFLDERNEIMLKIRAKDHEAILTGQRKISVEFKMTTDSSNAVWTAFQTAYLGHTTIELFCFYKYTDSSGAPAAGSKAYRVICEVSKFPLSQPLETIDSGDVVCKPSANASNAPSIYTAA